MVYILSQSDLYEPSGIYIREKADIYLQKVSKDMYGYFFSEKKSLYAGLYVTKSFSDVTHIMTSLECSYVP